MHTKPRLCVRQAVCLPLLAATLGVLSGCQAIVSNPSLAQVRVINASPDAPGLDIYQSNNALAYNLGSGTITSYIPFTPGTYTVTADSTGTRQILTTSKATIAPSTQYTLLIGDASASLQQLVLTDQSQPAPTGQVALRFINQATRTGAVDIYLIPAGQKLTAISPVVTGIAFGTNTGYLNVPTDAYTLVMVPTGTVPTSTRGASYTGAQVTYPSGSARTIILIDQQLVATPGLQVITAADYDSPFAPN
jgi:hypothetical protein